MSISKLHWLGMFYMTAHWADSFSESVGEHSQWHMHISSCLVVFNRLWQSLSISHVKWEISFTFDVHLWMGKMQQRDQLLWLLLAFPGYYQISLTSWAWSMVIAFSDRDEMVLLQCMFPLDVSPLSCCGWDILSRMKPDQILWKSHSGKAKCSIKYFHVWLIISFPSLGYRVGISVEFHR